LASVVSLDGHSLANEVWQAIADHLNDHEALASIAGGCEVDRQAAAEAMAKLTADVKTPLRTMVRLLITSYRNDAFRGAYQWLEGRLDNRFYAHAIIAGNALSLKSGIGYFANTRGPLTLRHLDEGLSDSTRDLVFHRVPQGRPTLRDLSEGGLLALALCGDKKKAACAACRLALRSNPGDGVYDFACELCQPC
jgi:hypothetical protein